MDNDLSPIYSILSSDPDFQELVQLFVEEMPGRLERIQNDCDLKNWQELSRQAHQLKGAAGSHGFGKISPAAMELETLIKTEAPEDQIVAANRKLIALCQRITAEPEPSA